MEIKQSLADEFFALNPEQRRLVHFMLCRHALDQWSLYANAQGQIEYRETVVGTRQVLDQQLPFEAYASAWQGLNAGDIAVRYREPITALHDEDLVFPENIVFAYYAVYNLFKKYG